MASCNILSKMVNGFKELVFLSKSSIFCTVHFRLYELVQISPACCPNTYQIMYGETLDFQCQHVLAQKSFNGKFTAQMDLPIGHFKLPLLTLTLKVWSLSIHYLISIWTTCWWNLNRIVWYERYKILSLLANNG